MYLIELARSGDDALFGNEHGDVLIGKTSTHTEPGPLKVKRLAKTPGNYPVLTLVAVPHKPAGLWESPYAMAEVTVPMVTWALGHEKYDRLYDIGYCVGNQTWYVRDAGRLG